MLHRDSSGTFGVSWDQGRGAGTRWYTWPRGGVSAQAAAVKVDTVLTQLAPARTPTTTP